MCVCVCEREDSVSNLLTQIKTVKPVLNTRCEPKIRNTDRINERFLIYIFQGFKKI